MAEALTAPLALDPAAVPADRVLPGGWYTLWAILAVAMFGFVDRQLITLAAAPLSASLKLSDTQLGTVQGLAFAVFTVVAVYPIAWAADRIDRRYVLGACVVTWSLGTAACGLVQNFGQLFAAAVAIAAGEAGLAPLTMSIVPDLFKGRKRALANGIQYFSAYLAVALALALGGLALGALEAAHQHLPPMLRQWEPWRLAFFMVASPAPLFLIAITFTRLRHPRSPSAPVGYERATEIHLAPFLRQHWMAMTTVLGSLALYLLAFGGFLVWLPVATTRLFSATASQNGLGMGLATGVGMVSGVAISTGMLRRLMARIGRRASVRIAWRVMFVTTPVLLVFPFAASFWQVYTLMGLLMLAGTAVGVLVPTMLQDMAPASMRARFLALYAIAAALCGGVTPSLVGLISDRLGTSRGLLFALAAVALPAWIASTLLMRLGERRFAILAEAVARADQE
ncbi:MAG: MFS transporter [Caulobacteraceae bacterium]